MLSPSRIQPGVSAVATAGGGAVAAKQQFPPPHVTNTGPMLAVPPDQSDCQGDAACSNHRSQVCSQQLTVSRLLTAAHCRSTFSSFCVNRLSTGGAAAIPGVCQEIQSSVDRRLFGYNDPPTVHKQWSSNCQQSASCTELFLSTVSIDQIV